MIKKLAIVTGAASGLGKEFARLLAEDGYDLVLVDIDRPGLEKVSEKLSSESGVNAEILVQDLGKAGAAEQIYNQVGDRDPDILINNAGFGMYGFFAETDWQIEESMLFVHVLNLTHLTKLFLKKMVNRGEGRILNTSSLAAFQPGPLMSVYYASKAYILSFSEAIANEVNGTGVTVTVLAPGWFRTNFQKTTARNSKVEESQAKLHTATAEKVAKKAYREMHRGRTLVIPGYKNKLMSEAHRIIPRALSVKIIRRIQERLRK